MAAMINGLPAGDPSYHADLAILSSPEELLQAAQCEMDIAATNFSEAVKNELRQVEGLPLKKI